MTSDRELVESYFAHYAKWASVVPSAPLGRMADVIWDAFLSGGMVYVFGNGACASLAAHMATDLSKGTAMGLSTTAFRSTECGTTPPRIRVVSLSDNTALLTAYGNDIGFDDVFVEQLRILLHPRDVVIGLSGSGRSPNVLRALEYAKGVGVPTLGLTGSQASAPQLLSRCEVAVQAPSALLEQIEDWHVIYNHVLTLLLRARLLAHFEIDRADA
jgi:D-sedoheptulose 7-phosphate isomerase